MDGDYHQGNEPDSAKSELELIFEEIQTHRDGLPEFD